MHPAISNALAAREVMGDSGGRKIWQGHGRS
jgi:hypothetical protein